MPRQHSTTKTNNKGVPLQCKLVVFRPLPHECPQVSNFERATNRDSVSWPCSRPHESTPNVPAVLPAIMERITEYHRIYQSIRVYQSLSESIRVYQSLSESINSIHTTQVSTRDDSDRSQHLADPLSYAPLQGSGSFVRKH